MDRVVKSQLVPLALLLQGPRHLKETICQWGIAVVDISFSCLFDIFLDICTATLSHGVPFACAQTLYTSAKKRVLFPAICRKFRCTFLPV